GGVREIAASRPRRNQRHVRDAGQAGAVARQELAAVDADRRAGGVDVAGAFDEPAVVDDQVAGSGDRAVVADEAALDAHVAGAEIERATGRDLAVIGVVSADRGDAAATEHKAVAVDFKCAARVSASDGQPASTLVTVLG